MTVFHPPLDLRPSRPRRHRRRVGGMLTLAAVLAMIAVPMLWQVLS